MSVGWKTVISSRGAGGAGALSWYDLDVVVGLSLKLAFACRSLPQFNKRNVWLFRQSTGWTKRAAPPLLRWEPVSLESMLVDVQAQL